MPVERRRYYRMPMSHILEIREFSFSETDEPVQSRLKDVSGGGVLLESGKPYNVGSLVELKLKIPRWNRHKTEFLKPDWTSEIEPLVTLGYVVRVEEIEARQRYEIGVVFECIDEDHRMALMRYIEELKGS